MLFKDLVSKLNLADNFQLTSEQSEAICDILGEDVLATITYPLNGTKYYYITSDYKVSCLIWSDSICDILRYNNGNYFISFDDAMSMLNYLFIHARLRYYSAIYNDELYLDDSDMPKYYICYDYCNKCVTVGVAYQYISNNIYFPTEEVAYKAIKYIGEDLLEMNYFHIKSSSELKEVD